MSEVGCTDVRGSLHAVGLMRFGVPGWAPRGASSQELARLQVQAWVTLVLAALGKDWAEAHMDEVLANREEYDTRVA